MPAVFFAATHVKIASGQTVSSEADLRGLKLVGIEFAVALTGATVTATAAERSGADFGPPTASFQAVGISTGAGALVPFSVPSNAAASVFFTSAVQISNCILKLVSAGAEAADRDIILYVTPLS